VCRAKANIGKARLAAGHLWPVVEAHFTQNVPWTPPSNRCGGEYDDPHQVWEEINKAVVIFVERVALKFEGCSEKIKDSFNDSDDDAELSSCSDAGSVTDDDENVMTQYERQLAEIQALQGESLEIDELDRRERQLRLQHEDERHRLQQACDLETELAPTISAVTFE
jgi:hypothetical protein